MPRKRRSVSAQERWIQLELNFKRDYPHIGGWLSRPDDFQELRIKSRDDGTVITIAKGYGPDGGPVVAFGVGYDVFLSLMALDASLQGDKWRVDKPWSPKGK